MNEETAPRTAFEDRTRSSRVFSILDEPLARYTLWYVQNESEVALTHLADVLTGWLHEDSGVVTTVDDRDRIRLLLYHVHLPALDYLGFVRFDHTEKTVSRGEIPSHVQAVLDVLREADLE